MRYVDEMLAARATGDRQSERVCAIAAAVWERSAFACALNSSVSLTTKFTLLRSASGLAQEVRMGEQVTDTLLTALSTPELRQRRHQDLTQFHNDLIALLLGDEERERHKPNRPPRTPK